MCIILLFIIFRLKYKPTIRPEIAVNAITAVATVFILFGSITL